MSRTSVAFWILAVVAGDLGVGLAFAAETTAPNVLLRSGFEVSGGIRSRVIGIGTTVTHVNTPRYRASALVSAGGVQFASWYDPENDLMVGRREGADWDVTDTGFAGDTSDPHNVSVLGIDGCGGVHLSWGMHVDPLNYARSATPLAVDFHPASMLGDREDRVTYPHFLRLADGTFLFLYRDGYSGKGDMIVNRYDCLAGTWTRLHSPLIAGEDVRNAYWQTAEGPDGSLHMSWTWRERLPANTGYTANRDIGYAWSPDSGLTWYRADGSPQPLPITSENTGYALRFPYGQGLMNQTSMTIAPDGSPIIALVLEDGGDPTVPQYALLALQEGAWQLRPLAERSTPNVVHLARPLLVTHGSGLLFVYRDLELAERIVIDRLRWPSLEAGTRTFLSDQPMGVWEPHIDMTRLQQGVFSIFFQVQEAVPGDPLLPRTGGQSPVAVIDYALGGS